jgi:hypothetical protein
MSRTSRSESSDALVLRTAAVWGTFVLASRELRAGQSLRLGEGEDALFAKPDQSPVADLPIIAVGRGWELDATGATGGSLHLRGRAEDPCELGKTGAPVPIVAGDYGLLQYGSFSVFFQFAHAAPALKHRFRVDLPLVLAFLFALLTLGGSLLLLYMLFPEQPLAKPLELTSARELEVKYHFTPPPPPEEPRSDAEVEAGSAGAKAKRPEAARGSSKRPPGPEPTSRQPAAAGADTKPGSSAMLEVMQGSVGKEVLESLGTISSVSDALGGLGSAGVVLGGQSGGLGLRASGGGGARDGTAAFGSGTLNTGFGSGAGVAGNGRGRVGSGQGDGTGAGRGGERRIAAAAGVASGQGLSPEQISRVVHARSGAFRACYESAAARDPRLQGGITVSFSVSPAGSVTARIANSSLANARVESCVLRMFNRLRFPVAERATSANWPLVFRPGK